MAKGLNFYDFIFSCLPTHLPLPPTRGQYLPVGGSSYYVVLLTTNYYYVLLIIKIMYAYSRLLYGNHSSASAVHQNLSAVVVIEVVLLAFLEPKQLFYG